MRLPSCFVALMVAACASSPDSAMLPDWHGTWAGTLVYGPPGGATASVPMEIRIGSVKDHPDRLRFALVYGSGDKRDVRDYELIAVDLSKGKVQIDEKNSIVLEGTLRNNTLVTSFVVGGQLTTCRYVLRGPVIEFSCESIDVDMEKGATTGGRIDAPKVTIPLVLSVQHARLVNPARFPQREHWLWNPRPGPYWHGPW